MSRRNVKSGVRRSIVAGVGLLVVTACTADPGPTPPPVLTVIDRGDPVFAYTETGRIRVMRAGTEVATVGTKTPVIDVEWTADGTRLVATNGTRLSSTDVRTGATATIDCTRCDTIAVAAGRVFAATYGATELTVHDVATLARVGPVQQVRPVTSIEGAGDRVVTFQIVADGARAATDVVVLDPATGASTTVGQTGPVATTAFTPRGWWGGPLFAYAATGSTGASTGVAKVVWFDPTSTAKQVETSDQELRELGPEVGEQNWNSGRDQLWWAADGTLRVTAWAWACADGGRLRGPTCADPTPRNQWRYDGAEWARTDERNLGSVRDIGDGHVLELTAGTSDRQLTLVRDESRTVIGTRVHVLSTPPRPGARRTGATGTQELAQRFAPHVWLHPNETSFPTDPSAYIRGAKLRFDHGDICKDDSEPVAEGLDPTRLGRGEGYQHRAGVGNPRLNRCEHPEDGRTFRSNAPVDQGGGGGKGFYLDGADDARSGNTPSGHNRVSAPVYWEYVGAKDGRRGAYLYWFFYAYNDSSNNHEGDWERVAVQVDGDKPVGVTFWKHGQPTCQVPWGTIEKAGTRPVTFSAHGSHGSYPREGEYPTKVGLDRAAKGFDWITSSHLLNVKDQPWYGYRGIWGRVGVFSFTTGPAGPWPNRDMSGALSTTVCPGTALPTPEEFVGSWRTTEPVTDTGGKPYHVQLQIVAGVQDKPAGTSAYPGVGCLGDLILSQVLPDKIILRETRSNPLVCPTPGIVTLTRTPTGLRYEHTSDARPGIVTAHLVRQ
jgi:hypothetical protein